MAFMHRNERDVYLERARHHMQGALREMNRGSRYFADEARKRGQIMSARSNAMMADTQRHVSRHPWSSAGIAAAVIAIIGVLLFWRRNH